MFFGVWIVLGITAVLCARQFLCPKPGSRCVLGIASTIFVLAGAPPSGRPPCTAASRALPTPTLPYLPTTPAPAS